MNLPFQISDRSQQRLQSKRRLDADDDGGRININDVNDGWKGEARLAEEEEALRKNCSQDVAAKTFRKPRTPPQKSSDKSDRDLVATRWHHQPEKREGGGIY